MVHSREKLDRLYSLLQPMFEPLAGIFGQLRDKTVDVHGAYSQLKQRFPYKSSYVDRVKQEISLGITEGWLCDRGHKDARFSRISKPKEQNFHLSVDLVQLQGAGMRHRHPGGEITLGFVAETSPLLPESAQKATLPTFDGQAPGWVVYGPQSTHTPRVAHGQMNLLYFLPGGQVEWDPQD